MIFKRKQLLKTQQNIGPKRHRCLASATLFFVWVIQLLVIESLNMKEANGDVLEVLLPYVHTPHVNA